MPCLDNHGQAANVTEAELAYFDSLPGSAADPYSFYGFPSGGAAARVHGAESRLVSDAGGTLAVDLQDAVIGDVQWHAVPYGPPPMSNAFNIDIRMGPARQGQGHGTSAQSALAEYVLATYPVNRIERLPTSLTAPRRGQ